MDTMGACKRKLWEAIAMSAPFQEELDFCMIRDEALLHTPCNSWFLMDEAWGYTQVSANLAMDLPSFILLSSLFDIVGLVHYQGQCSHDLLGIQELGLCMCVSSLPICCSGLLSLPMGSQSHHSLCCSSMVGNQFWQGSSEVVGTPQALLILNFAWM